MDAIKTINAAFDAIPDLQDGWQDVKLRLFDMNLEQERRHRKGSSAPKRFSANVAAKYFVCKHLLDGIAEPNKFTVDDILSIRTEVLYAQAYAKKHAANLIEWASAWNNALRDIDYSKLMRVA